MEYGSLLTYYSEARKTINKLSTFLRRYSQALFFDLLINLLWFTSMKARKTMKKISLIALSVLFTATMAQAAMLWKPGFVVTNTGDTIRGDVRINDKKEFDLFRKVTVKLSESQTKMFNPNKVKEYTVDGKHFVARMVDDEMVFVKVVSEGGVTLYQHQFEVYHGDEIRYDSEYYVAKAGADELTKVKESKFKKLVAELMSDNEDLVKKVQENDAKYEGDAIVEIFNEYNAWYREQKKG